jgi:putative ABC transport system permease protein
MPARIRAIVCFRRLERDLDDELSLHLELETRANLDAGMTEAEAMRRARLSLGGVEHVKERSRDVRPLRWARDLIQDLRYTQRSLRREPGFTVVTVITLALGVGANTALFSVVSAVVLRPLPYPQADRLVRVWTAQPHIGLPRSGTALPDYRAWRDGNRTFTGLGAFDSVTYTVTGAGRPEVLAATRMTASLWGVLGREPLVGRLFSGSDEQWGAHRVAVVSEGLWRRRFGGDAGAIGRTLQLDGQPFTVIGVMPASFVFPGPGTEMWSPIAYAPGDDMDSRHNRFVDMLGRLKPGVTAEQALSDLSAIAERLRRQFPENAGVGVTLQGWHESTVGGVRPTLMFLLGAVAFVLLIACANVANLLLARTASREHELMVRATIGAGRGRLVRQLLTEHLVLAWSGTAAGVAVAYALIDAIAAVGQIGVPRLDEVAMDGRVLGFAAALAIITALAVGVWPARQAGDVGLLGRLGESARTFVGGRTRARVRRTLVTAQVSLSLVLMIGATLLIVSLQRLQRVDPGFDVERLLTATIALPPDQYSDAERVARFIHAVIDQVNALPDVRAAGTTTALPLEGREWGKYFTIEGHPAPPSLAQVPNIHYRQITPGYLRAMEARLRAGRLFTEEDGLGQPLVAIVNETLAHRFWPEAHAVGRRISMTPPESLLPPEVFPPGVRRLPYRTVVGVIGDFRQNGLDREAEPEVFVPLAQLPMDAWKEQFAREFTSNHFLVARTVGAPLAVTGVIQAVVSRLDPNLPLANVRTMESRLAQSMAQRRVATALLSAFAGLALLLALVGLYGVMAYTVSQRHRELGLRAALGASVGSLLRLVMADGLRMTLTGAAVGLLLAGTLSRLMAAHLFQV